MSTPKRRKDRTSRQSRRGRERASRAPAASTPENQPGEHEAGPPEQDQACPESLACIVRAPAPPGPDLCDWTLAGRPRTWGVRRFNRWPGSALGSWAWRQAARWVRAGSLAPLWVLGSRSEAWLAAQFEEGVWPTRPLRIGVADAELLDVLQATVPTCEVQWIGVPRGTLPALPGSRVLDCLVSRSEEREIHVETPEAPGRDAAWHNPAAARPITFSTLFPGRVDFAVAKLPEGSGRQEPQLFRTFLESAAAFSRHRSRLTLADRFAGRLPLIHAEVATRVPPARDPFQNVQRMLAVELGAGLERLDGPPTALRLAAARLVSAYLAGSDDGFPDSLRHGLLERCVGAASDEPEVLLRAAAGRVAAYADDRALEAIVRAERALRHHPLAARGDQIPFLQAELQTGQGTPISLGRVAAGIALICAGMDNTQAAFFRDDLLDEARFSQWLIPREQDRRFIMNVFRAILTSRREDRYQRARAA